MDKWMEERRVALLEKYESSGRKASGKFGNSIVIETSEQGGKMSGAKHAWYMVNGRQPNKDQSEGGLAKFARWAGHYIFKQWIKDKGLSLNPYAIAYHVAKNGIKVPNDKNDGKLLTDTFNDESIKDLGKRLANNEIKTITSNIQKEWQQ